MERVPHDDDQLVTDLGEIAKAARALAKIIEKDWPENEQERHPVILLLALCRLVETSTEDPNKGWLPFTIAQKMIEIGVSDWGHLKEVDTQPPKLGHPTHKKIVESSRKLINKHWKALINNFWERRLNELIPRLMHDLQVDFLAFTPELDKIDDTGASNLKGGSGHEALYRLRFFQMSGEKFKSPNDATSQPDSLKSQNLPSPAPIGSDEPATQQSSVSPAPIAENYIQYYPIPLTTLRFLRLPDDGLSLGGWVGRLLVVLMTGPGLAILLFALLIFWVVFYTTSTVEFLRMLLLSVVLLIELRVVFNWWWNLVQNHVARAPFWWQSISVFGDNVIEKRMDPNGTAPASLHLVRYVADCPLCGATDFGRSAVRLDSGRLEFFGRIVGRCRHAPNEHVWSFDHVTERGRFLR